MKPIAELEYFIEIYFFGPINRIKSKFKKVNDFNEGNNDGDLSFVKGIIIFENLSELKDFNVKSLKFIK